MPARSVRPARSASRQIELPFRTRGGARVGAGRKPNGARAGVSHLRRVSFRRGQPLHVTLRLREGVPTLRSRQVGAVIFSAFARARERLGIRLTHFSVQANHLHLLVEAADRGTLSRAMQGLCIRLARRLNRTFRRSGSLFADRYHARVLRTPLEVRHAVLYVMNNFRRHLAQRGEKAPWDWADPYSSVDHFDGFRSLERSEGRSRRRPSAEFSLGRAPPVVAPRSWLLRVGWRQRGLLDVDAYPGAGVRRHGGRSSADARSPSREARASGSATARRY